MSKLVSSVRLIKGDLCITALSLQKVLSVDQTKLLLSAFGCPEPPLHGYAGLLLVSPHICPNPVGIPDIGGHLLCLIDTPV